MVLNMTLLWSIILKNFSVPQTPAPGEYECLSIFGEAKKNNKGFCFGGGRD